MCPLRWPWPLVSLRLQGWRQALVTFAQGVGPGGRFVAVALVTGLGIGLDESAVHAANLQAGVARMDITPSQPVQLAGYGSRKALSRDVHDPLFARALAFQRGDYEAAIPLLREYLRKYPNGRNASRAQFFLGKAYIGLGRLSEAAIEFDATVRNYPGTLEAHKSRYKLAMIAYWQGDSIEARRRFEKLADNPDGTLAPEARAMAEYLSGIESQSQNAASYGEY